jgi:hypothetical protein
MLVSYCLIKGVFGSIVEVVFQSAFRLEMHQNNVFLKKRKIIFDINTSKRSKNIKKII